MLKEYLYTEKAYPFGCRCSCCKALFEEGDTMITRPVKKNCVVPVCLPCALADAELEPNHPLKD